MKTDIRRFAIIAVAVSILAAFFGCGGGAPTGREFARHVYQGETYVLVEYGDKLAMFTGSGTPVTGRSLAGDVLHSYAWKQSLDGLDIGGLTDTVDKVEEIDSRIAGVRSLSNATVDIFDELESLSADILFVGEISAMDAVREVYPGVGAAERSIRSLNSELNDFGDNAEALSQASGRAAGLKGSSDIDGNEMDRLFREAVSAAQGLESTVQSVSISVSDVREAASTLESALRDASGTPIIGGAIGGLASTAGRFESELSELTGLLGDFRGELSELSAAFQAALDSAAASHEDFMERWLEEPHDPQWPPAGAERAPAGSAAQSEGQARRPAGSTGQGNAEVATQPASAPPEDGPIVISNPQVSMEGIKLYGPIEAPIDEDDDIFLLAGKEGVTIKGPTILNSRIESGVNLFWSGAPGILTHERGFQVTVNPDLRFMVLLDDDEGEVELGQAVIDQDGLEIHSMFTLAAHADGGGRVDVLILPVMDGCPGIPSQSVSIEVRPELEDDVRVGSIPLPPAPQEPPDSSVNDRGGPYSWEVEGVEFAADSIVVTIGDREFPVLCTAYFDAYQGVHSEAEFAVGWSGGDIAMRLDVEFAKDATKWRFDRLSTYDGTADAHWVDYDLGHLPDLPLGSAFQSNIILHGVTDNDQPAKLTMTGARINPFSMYEESASLEDSLTGLLLGMGELLGRYYGPGYPERQAWGNLDAGSVASILEDDISGSWTCGGPGAENEPVARFLERNASWPDHKAPRSFMDEVARIPTWAVEVSGGTGRVVSNLGPGFEIFQGDFVLEDNYWRLVPDFIEGCSRR